MHRLTLTIAFMLAGVLVVAPAPFAQQPAASGPFAIEHVTVINIETGAKSPDQTVVVSGNRITAVGPAAKTKAPAGARVVDGTGKFLIPGIWDMHVHALRAMQRALPLAVANGLTGIRDMGSTVEQVAEARKGGILAPRMFVSGPPLDGVPSRPGFPPGAEIKTSEEGRKIVDELAAAKVDQLKIHNGLARNTYYAIAAEAKRKGLPFEGHLPPDVNIIAASDAGQRTVEHMNGLQAACAADPTTLGRGSRNAQPNTQPIAINQAKCNETIRHLLKNGTWLTPTIGAPGTGDPRTRQFTLAIVKMAAQGGLRLLAGTDWPGPGYSRGDYSSAGRSVTDELAGLVEAGLTPREALRTATVNPAILFKMTNQLGSVERGKLADLLLLDGDPLADIGNTKRIAAVVVNGRLIDSAARKKILDDEQAARQNTGRGS